MRTILYTIAALTLTLMSLDAYGQRQPRSRGRRTDSARTDENRSPSMSRVRQPSRSPRPQPAVSSPSRRRANKPSALRQGIGPAPSGARRRNGGQMSSFLRLPGSRGRPAVQPHRGRRKLPVYIGRTPSSRKPNVYTGRTPRGPKPPVYTSRTPNGRKLPVYTGRAPSRPRLPVYAGRLPSSRRPNVYTGRPPSRRKLPVYTRRAPSRPKPSVYTGRTPNRPKPPVYPGSRPRVHRTVQPARRAGYSPPSYRPRWGHKAPFTLSWYEARPAVPQHYRPPVHHPWRRRHPRYKPSHWWTWATTRALTAWMHRRWSRPEYYVYGTTGNVYYDGGVVYVDGARCASTDAYYSQAHALALAAPRFDDATAETVEWLPLGVFAFVPTGASQANSYFQLAVTRDGVIGGTYIDEAANTIRPIEGTVDKLAQRAAWTFADGKNTDIVFETSIHNLTKDRAPVLMHVSAARTQQGTLVRMKAPQGE